MGWFSQPSTLTVNLTNNPNPNQAGHGLKHFTIPAIELFEKKFQINTPYERKHMATIIANCSPIEYK